jgi:ankyrin repeat protein
MSNTGWSYATSYEDWNIREANQQFYEVFNSGMTHNMISNHIKSILNWKYMSDIHTSNIKRGNSVRRQIPISGDEWSGGSDDDEDDDSMKISSVDVNCPGGEFENTPLLMAIQSGNLQAVEILLSFNADANLCQKSKNGRSSNLTPLHLAVCNYRCGFEMMTVLLAYGASVYSKDSSLKTILHYVCQNHVADLSKLNSELVQDKMRKYTLVMSNIEPVRLNEMLNCRDLNRNIPLHTAIAYHRYDIAADLVHEGSDVNSRNDLGYSPLNWAILNLPSGANKFNAGECFTVEFVIESMLQWGDINSKANNGDTPLDTAMHLSQDMSNTQKWVVELLKKRGARSSLN